MPEQASATILPKSDLAPDKPHKDIVYISAYGGPGDSAVVGLIEHLFNCSCDEYVWEVEELAKTLNESEPMLVIFAPQLLKDGTWVPVWNNVQDAFPKGTKMIWLTPEDGDIPDFLPADDNILGILVTPESFCSILIREIERLTGRVPNWRKLIAATMQ
jgi:hypothetical protein